MTRVLIGEALVNENERLQRRINQLHDRIEAELRQCLRFASDKQPEVSGPLANLLMCFAVGRWHQFAKSGFTRQPGVDAEIILGRLLEALPA
jgi:TetR/AcrR family transcriptional regulator